MPWRHAEAMGSRVCKSLLGDRHARGERARRASRANARPCKKPRRVCRTTLIIVGFSRSFVQMLGTPETSEATLRLRHSSRRAFQRYPTHLLTPTGGEFTFLAPEPPPSPASRAASELTGRAGATLRIRYFQAVQLPGQAPGGTEAAKRMRNGHETLPSQEMGVWNWGEDP